MMRTWKGRVARAAQILCVALALAVVLPVAASGPAPAPAARADSLSSQIAAARQRQQQLQQSIQNQKSLLGQLNSDETMARSALKSTAGQLDGINANQAEVQQQIQTATDALHRIQARQIALTEQLRQLDWTLSLLQSQIDQGDQDLQAQQRALGLRLADAYRTGQTSLLEQLLSSNSFSDVVSQTSAYLSYGQQDVQLAQQIAQDQAALDSLRRVTAATRFQTDELRREAQQTQAELEAQQQQLQAATNRLANLQAQTTQVQNQQLAAFNTINNTQDKVNAYLKNAANQQAAFQKKIAGLVKKAQQEAARRAARRHRPNLGGSGNGMFIWPTTGVVTQEFGCTGFPLEPPLGSCAHFHQGIDIASASGTPVHAAADGVIASIGFNPYDGAFIVVIGHAKGFETMYVHLLPDYVVRSGQFVHQGQLIGYMGDTGHSTGTHLHWQVNLNGNPVNPRSYV